MLKTQKITPYIIEIQGVKCVEKVLITGGKWVDKQPSFQHLTLTNTAVNSFSTAFQQFVNIHRGLMALLAVTQPQRS